MIVNDVEKKVIIYFSEDFTRIPGGEFIEQSKYSGELFMKLFLEAFMLLKYKITIVIGNIYGMPHTFIRGAFLGLQEHIYDKAGYEPSITILVDSESDNKIANDISEYIDVITI